MLLAYSLCFAQSQDNLEYVAKQIKADTEQLDTLSFEMKDIDVNGNIYSCECEAIVSENEKYTYILSEVYIAFDRFIVILNKLDNKK